MTAGTSVAEDVLCSAGSDSYIGRVESRDVRIRGIIDSLISFWKQRGEPSVLLGKGWAPPLLGEGSDSCMGLSDHF